MAYKGLGGEEDNPTAAITCPKSDQLAVVPRATGMEKVIISPHPPDAQGATAHILTVASHDMLSFFIDNPAWVCANAPLLITSRNKFKIVFF